MPNIHTPRFRRFINRMAMLSGIIALCTLLIILYLLWKQRQIPAVSCETWLTESIQPLPLRTQILDIYEEEGFRWVALSDSVLTRIKLCDCGPSCDLLSAASAGDSLIKISGQMEVLLKGTGKGGKLLTFPFCE